MKKKISLTLDEDVINEVRVLAEKNDRKLSRFVNIILKAYLKGKNKKK